MNYPDALGAGAAAGSYDVPGAGSGLSAVVVLTDDNKLPPATKAYIESARVGNSQSQVFGVGTQGLIATAAYDPVNIATIPGSSASRYLTSLLTAQVFFGGISRSAGLATATNWPDSLAGGAFLASQNGPMLITGPTMDRNIEWFFDSNSPALNTLYIFGTPSSVSNANAGWAGVLISGPGGTQYTWNQNSAAQPSSGPKDAAPAAARPDAHSTLKEIIQTATDLQKPQATRR
jgi:hypothetical protein